VVTVTSFTEGRAAAFRKEALKHLLTLRCENRVVETWGQETWGQEDVKKSICLSSRDFIFDPKCLPTPQRSFIRHPGAIFFNAEFAGNLKIDFFTSSRQEDHRRLSFPKKYYLAPQTPSS
jgi:hypothetical protein